MADRKAAPTSESKGKPGAGVGPLRITALAVVLALSGVAANGQEERKPLVLEEWDGEVVLEDEYFRWETESRNSARTVIERNILRQMLRLGFEGYSFDPRLLEYRLGLELGYDFIDEKFESPFDSLIPDRTSTNADRINYDLLIQLLPDSRETLTLWARRRDYSLNDLLFDVFDIKEEAYGARFDTLWSVAPFSIMVEHREVDELGLFEDTHEEADYLLFQLRKRFNDQHRLDLEYEYLDRTRTTTGEIRSPEFIEIVEESHRADGFYEYRFGRDLRSNATTWLSYFDQKGSFPYRNTLGRERVILYHSPRLQTDYAATYHETDINGRTIETGELEAGLRHRLYDNLITRLEGRYRKTDDPVFSLDEFELLGNWNYWRHTPWGRLLVNYLIAGAFRDTSNGGGAENLLTNRLEVLHEFPFPLRAYYRFEDQRLDTDFEGRFAITDSTAHTVGYEVPWKRWAWLQEFRHVDDTLGRTDRFYNQLWAAFDLPLHSQINMRLSYEDIRYHGRVEDSQILAGQLGYILPFARTGLFEMDAYAADRQGIVDDQEFHIRSTLGWDWRKLRVRFSGQYGLFDNQRSDTRREGTHLLLTLSRDLR